MMNNIGISVLEVGVETYQKIEWIDEAYTSKDQNYALIGTKHVHSSFLFNLLFKREISKNGKLVPSSPSNIGRENGWS